MKKLIILLFPLFSLSQNSEPKLYLATFNEKASFAGDYLGNCALNPELELFRGQIVPVSGVIEYDNCSVRDFCEFYYRGKKLFANVDELEFANGDLHELIMLRYDVKDSIRAIAQKYSEKIVSNQDKKAKAFIANSKKNGVVITYANLFDESEYTKGTGFKIAVYNTENKVIKYVNCTVTGINAVNDVVSSKAVQGIGPIKKDEEGVFEFNYVWMTDIVEKFKLTLKIQYMDGTFKTISGAEKLVLEDDALVLWNETHRN